MTLGSIVWVIAIIPAPVEDGYRFAVATSWSLRVVADHPMTDNLANYLKKFQAPVSESVCGELHS